MKPKNHLIPLMLSSICLLQGLLVLAQCDGLGFRKVYGYSNQALEGHAVIADDAGVTAVSVLESGPHGGKDWVVFHTDPSGELEWAQAIGTNLNDEGTNVIIKDLANGDFLVAGYTHFGNSDRNMVMSRHASDGSFIWGRQVTGLSEDDTPRDIMEMDNGDLWLIGTTNSFSFGSSDAFVAVFEADGDQIWGDHFGGGNNDHFYGIERFSDGRVALIGNTQSFLQGTHHIWVVTLDITGQVLEEHLFHGDGLETGFSACIDDDDNLYICGYTIAGGSSQNSYLMKLNSELEYQWTRVHYSNVNDRSSELLWKDGVIYMSTTKASSALTPPSDIGLNAFNTDGELLWSKRISGPGMDEVQFVSGNLDTWGDSVYLLGSSGGILAAEASLLCATNSCGEDGCNEDESDVYTDYIHSHMLTDMSRASWGQFIAWNPSIEPIELTVVDVCEIETEPCELTGSLSLTLPVCPDDALIVAATADLDELYYQWQVNGQDNGSDELLVLEDLEPGEYEIVVEVGDVLWSCTLQLDTVIVIEAWNAPVWLHPEMVVLCEGESYTYDLEDGFDWMVDGEPVSEAFVAGSPGEHEFLAIDENGCEWTFASMVFQVDAPMVIPPETIDLCGSIWTFELDPSWTWFVEGEEFTGELQLSGTGILEWKTALAGCTYNFVTAYQAYQPVSPGWATSYEVCFGDSLELQVPSIEDLYWQGEPLTTTELSISEAGSYQWESGLEDCSVVGTIEVVHVDCTEEFLCDETACYVPNAFSPNNDGVNDVFIPMFDCEPIQYELIICSRWGLEVFRSTDPHAAWNGSFREGDHYVQNEVYVWMLKWTMPSNYPVFLERSGSVTLVR